MERQLKHHEKKLLKNHKDFVGKWKEDRPGEAAAIRKYNIQDVEDLVGSLLRLKEDDSFRIKMTDQLLDKLYGMGLIEDSDSLQEASKISYVQFCKRRLNSILLKNGYCEKIDIATNFVRHGHIKVGPHVVRDPAKLITRNMEDFVTWSDASKIKKTVMKFNDQFDDFDLLGL